MSSRTLTPAKARSILIEIAVEHKRWGRQMSSPHRVATIYEAIEVAYEAGLIGAEPEAPLITKEELTKLRRQLAAALNREKARKHGPEAEAARAELEIDDGE